MRLNLFNARCPWFPEGTFDSLEEKEQFRKVYNDGRRIYTNRLAFYPTTRDKSLLKPSAIQLGQLYFKDLGIDDSTNYNIGSSRWRRPEVKNAIIHTMVYEEGLLEPLIKSGVPITVFKEAG